MFKSWTRKVQLPGKKLMIRLCLLGIEKLVFHQMIQPLGKDIMVVAFSLSSPPLPVNM